MHGMAIYRITVKDNGIGMSEEFQKHLFESFSRERSTTVSKQEGAGLGLAIVKKDVDRSLAAGMNAHAVKPIDVKNLFETIQRLVKE